MSEVSVPVYILNFETNFDNRIVFFAAQIRSLLKLTTDLLDICYDCEIETRKTPTDESIDLGQISNQLVELRNALETLFEAAKTNGAHPPGIVPSVDVLYKLLSTCRNNINQVETALKQQSSRKRIKGPSSSSSPQEILTNLASSAVDLKRVVGGIQQYVNIIWKKYDAENVHQGLLLEPALDIQWSTSAVGVR